MKLLSLAISMILAPSLCFAADDFRGAYVGLGTGLTDLKQSAKGQFSGQEAGGNAWGARVFGGYRAFAWLGAEVAYNYAGSVSGSRSGVLTRLDAKTTTVSALLFVPLPSSTFELYGKFGYANNDGKLRFPTVNTYEKLSGTGQAYGIGTNWRRDSWSLRLEYELVNTSYEDVTFVSVNVARYMF